jgi:SIR2-like domain
VNVADHEAFWTLVCSRFRVTAVVTTNYDLLVERGLRHRSMRSSDRPGMYYGGLGRPQVLKGTALPFSAAKPERFIELEGNIPLYKLHGSLNWGLEAGALRLYQDLRPAFRHGGDAQIVPPVVEKEAPSWLLGVWDGARQALASCSTWLVCGYSLPSYDRAITQLVADAGTAGAPTRIVLMDPHATELASRWQVVAPSAKLHLLPGLPEALRPLLEFAG